MVLERSIPGATFAALTLALGVLSVGPALGQDGGGDVEISLRDIVTNAIDFYNGYAKDPLVRLDSDEFASLEQGEVVVLRRREGRRDAPDDPHHRVFGYLLVEAPLLDTWLAGMHPDYIRDEKFTYAVHTADDRGNNIAYMYMFLPWPVTDRHSLMKGAVGTEIAEASNGYIWESTWDVADDEARTAREMVELGRVTRVTMEDFEGAIFLPVNYGGFIVFKIGDEQSLLGWHLTTDVGGMVPESWVAAFAAATLDESLSDVAARAEWILDEYTPDDDPIYSGFGELIPYTGAGTGGRPPTARPR